MFVFKKNKNKKNKLNENLRSKFSFLLTTHYSLPTNKGFTLVETLVAITILLLSITGPMVLVQRGTVSARYSRNQITAFYLSQEVMEFVKNKRDSNFISNQTDWLLGLENCIGVGNKCVVDVTNDSVSSCGQTCPVLKKSAEGLYGYGSTWSETSFRREVRITQSIENIDEIFVQVEIFWNGESKNFLGRESIFKLN